MNRRVEMRLLPLFGVACVALLLPLSLRAEIDGEKAKERQEAARPELAGEDAHAQEHERLIKMGRENLEEIQRLLDSAQSGLRGQETGNPTQESQAEAVEKMNLLIKELGKGCKQCSSGGSGGKQKKQSGNPQQKPGEQQKQQQQKPGSRQKQQKMQAQQQKPDAKQEKKDGETENDRADQSDLPDNRFGKLGDGLHKFERWGMLPPKMVEEMLSTSAKEAPPEYRQIVSRYYKRIIDATQRRNQR